MKCFAKLILTYGFLTAFSTHSKSQSRTDYLALYDKVWGFIKYHHPNVASGKLDWDSVYIAHFNDVINVKDVNNLNRQLNLLLRAAGSINVITRTKTPVEIFKTNFDLSWLNNKNTLTLATRKRLKYIYNNRNQGSNHFIRYNNQSDFSGEKKYVEMLTPDLKYRQLFLARFWSIINYFGPYKYLVSKDWNQVLNMFIPKFMSANDKVNWFKALLELSTALHDGHSYVSLNGDDAPINDLLYGNLTAPFYAEMIGDTAVVRKVANDTLCKKANIKEGDIILSIDAQPTIKKIKYLGKYISGSNKVSQYSHVVRRLFDTPHITERLQIKRADKVIFTTVTCMPVKAKNWGDINNYTYNNTGYKTYGKSISYIYAAQIWNGNLDTIKKIINRSKAVIFDVRNYPGNDDFFNIMGIMLPEPKYINYSTFFMADNPGLFKWELSHKIGDDNANYFRGQTIILVDERSQSQGEYSAMVLQTIPKSITIGSQTAGADGTVSPVPMGGGLSISYSGYGVYYPNKLQTQQVGVKIDFPVRKTIANIRDKTDPVVEKAISYLKEKGIY